MYSKKRIPTQKENHFYQNVKHHRGLDPGLLTGLSFIPVKVCDISVRNISVQENLLEKCCIVGNYRCYIQNCR